MSPFSGKIVDGAHGRPAGLAQGLGADIDLHQGKGRERYLVAMVAGFLVQPFIFQDGAFQADGVGFEYLVDALKVFDRPERDFEIGRASCRERV
mgnify:CR=1 FL=1